MKNLKLMTLTALLAVPMMMSCNPGSGASNTITYKGQSEFVIENDRVNLELELKEDLKDGEYVDEPTVSGHISGDASFNLEECKVEVLNKVVTVTIAFKDFRNESYFSTENLKISVKNKSKTEVCNCTIKNFKVSWPEYGGESIKCNTTIDSKSGTEFPILFTCSNITDYTDKKITIYAGISDQPEESKIEFEEKPTIQHTGGKFLKSTFKFKNFGTSTETFKVSGAVAVYNQYGIILSYGFFETKLTHTV